MAFAKREYFEDRRLKILREKNEWIGQMKEMGVVMEPKRSQHAKKDRAVFERFYKAFCFAVDQREILRESSKPKKKKDIYEHLPPTIKTLVELQDEDGKWTIPLSKLERVLKCDLPEGRDVTSWRWVTALILVLLRSHPEYYKHTRAPCDLATFWVRDPSLLERAREEMQPIVVTREPRTFKLDREMIRQGRYKDAQSELLDKYGYRSFLTMPEDMEKDKDFEVFEDKETRLLKKRQDAKEEDVGQTKHAQTNQVRDCAIRLAMTLDGLDTSEPILWNGCDVLISLRSSLDFLGDCESLRSWYGDEYPYTKNPFALSLPLSECPKDTYVKLSCSHDQKQDGDRPLSAWRKIEIMKTEAKNNKAREAFEASVYEWHARLQQCPRWWPNQNISTEKGSDIRRALVVIFG